MAKKRLKLKDKQGNVIDYDISAASVTIDAEGKSVQVKIAELVAAIAEAVKTVVYNGEQHIVNNGRVDIGNQMQSDWSESSQSYPTFIKNKPNVVTGIKVGASGSTITPTNGVVTLPEISSQPECDTAMSSTSEAPVQNKVIKAYVDNLINGLINGAPQALDTLKELADALSDNDDAVAALTTLIDTKQGLLTFDNAPTENSNNPVKSGGVYDAIEDKLTSVTVNSIPSGEVQIVDDLETDDATKVLSAKQGKVLNDRLEDVEENGAGGVVYDSLASNSSGAALSARQGKLIYDNILTLISSIRPSAFWDGAPTLDWVGNVTLYNVTYSASNCSAGTSDTQVSDGGTLIAEFSPSTGYTLEGATVGVSDGVNSVSHNASYNSTTGKLTVTVRNVTTAISVSVTAVVLRTVTMSLTNLTWDGPTTVRNGGTLEGYLQASGTYALPSSTPTVSGTTGTVIYDSTSGKLTVTNVTSNITITASAVAGHSVTATIKESSQDVATDKVTLNNTNGVSDGGTYEGQLTITQGWQIDSVTVLMGSTDVSTTAYDSSDNSITVSNVTDDITITVLCSTIMKITRGNSLNLFGQPANSNISGTDTQCYTDYIPLTIKENDVITWFTGLSARSYIAGSLCIGLYDKNKKCLYKNTSTYPTSVQPIGINSYGMSNSSAKSVTLNSSYIVAANLANGTSGDEVEVYIRASFGMTNGDVTEGCYLTQTRNGSVEKTYTAVRGLSELTPNTHNVTINHVDSNGDTTEITNGTAAYIHNTREVNIWNYDAWDSSTLSHITAVKKFFHGDQLRVRFTAKTGFAIDSVVVMLGSTDVTSDTSIYDPTNQKVVIDVTENVTITVTTKTA